MSIEAPRYIPETEGDPELDLHERHPYNDPEVNELIEHGSVEIKGPIEDFIDVAPHRNVVELAYINVEHVDRRNLAQFVEVKDENGHKVEAIFKPENGEDRGFLGENSCGRQYTREAAAYTLSEHFKLEVVPPTTVREINGNVGSLQLYLPKSDYKTFGEIGPLNSEERLRLRESDDSKLMHVLDWIMANADRHGENYLIKANSINEENSKQPTIVAIDNGLSFNSYFYERKSNQVIDLPSGESSRDLSLLNPKLTVDYKNNYKPLYNPLPNWIIKKIESGYDRIDDLTQKLELRLADETVPEEITSLRKRVEALIKYKVYLSGYNYKNLEGGEEIFPVSNVY